MPCWSFWVWVTSLRMIFLVPSISPHISWFHFFRNEWILYHTFYLHLDWEKSRLFAFSLGGHTYPVIQITQRLSKDYYRPIFLIIIELTIKSLFLFSRARDYHSQFWQNNVSDLVFYHFSLPHLSATFIIFVFFVYLLKLFKDMMSSWILSVQHMSADTTILAVTVAICSLLLE